MRYLLDTHTLAWAVRAPHLLSERAASLLSDSGNEILVSPASPWEMSIKFHVGKWPEVAPFLDDKRFRQYMKRLGALELPIRASHARLAGAFKLGHKDPFDRIICAQSAHEGLLLLSKDERLDSFPVKREW